MTNTQVLPALQGGLRILITNLNLANYSGSETVVELLADGLRRAGHMPMLLAPTLGPQAHRMRERGHLAVDRIAALPARPDIIHAQHTPVALSALAAFPDVPAVFACHSAAFEVEAPRLHPQIRQWIAVDDLCRERCISRGVPDDRLTTVLNAVDLQRFLRRAPLPPRPERALLLTKNHEHHRAVRTACQTLGILLDELGPGTGRVSAHIETELPAYDLVFATARMALEAAAVGCAVVVCDSRGFAGMLTNANLSAWRRLNFGAGLLVRPTTPEAVLEAIEQFDAGDAAQVTDFLRAQASLDVSIAAHLDVYNAALCDQAPLDHDACRAATVAWIEDLVPSAISRDWNIVAREIYGLNADPPTAFLLGLEQRLRDQVAETATKLQAEMALHFLDVREAAKPKSDPSASDAARLLWRRFVPRVIRRPLHRLRQRLS
jgi:glycosyltransferase involved in cell wall biosynthesis